MDLVTCEKCLKGERIGDRKKNRKARAAGVLPEAKEEKKRENIDPKYFSNNAEKFYAPAYSLGTR